jgi:AraC-like DNA-binding protein
MPFVLGGLPDAESVELLRAAFRDYPMPLELRPRWARQVKARFDGRDLGGLRIEEFRIEGASGDVERRVTTRDSAVPAQLTVHVPQPFSAQQLHQDGRSAHPRAGDLVLSTTQLPFTTSQTGSGRQFTFTFGYDELGLPSQLLLPLVAHAISGRDGLARVVAAFLCATAAAALGTGSKPPQAGLESLPEPALHLVRGLILSLHGDELGAREPLAASLAERLLQYADAHLGDSDLSAEELAAMHGISTRYVYVVLSRRGVTLGDWLRERRLERAASMLREARSPRLTVAAIAASVGFGDQAHFTRSFKARFGMTPTQWRDDGADVPM